MTHTYLLIICGFVLGSLMAVAGRNIVSARPALLPDGVAKVVFAAASAMILPGRRAVGADRTG